MQACVWHGTAGRGLVLALALALAVGQAAGAADVVRMSAEQIRALGIETAPLGARGAAEQQGVPGEVMVPPRQLRVIAAPVAGLMEQILVPVGSEVSKGQVLARFASPQLAEMQRGLLQAAAQVQLTRDNLDRDQRLEQEGIIAASRLRATRSQHAEAAAALAERRQALRLAGLSDDALGRLQSGQPLAGALEIRAPMDGVVIETGVSAGQRVEAAAALFKLARLTPLWLELQVPATRLGRVEEGTAVTVPAVGAKGRVLAIARSVGANQTVAVRAEIVQGADRLRPGQFVEATLSGAAGAGQWQVPNAALVRSAGRLQIFVLGPEGFVAKPVELVSEGRDDSLVSGALKGDERVAVRGVAALKAAAAGIGGE